MPDGHATPDCAAKHTKAPTGYVAWHEWAEKKSKTHDQMPCPDCGRYAIWKRKAATRS